MNDLVLNDCYLVTFRLLGDPDQTFIGTYKGRRPMLSFDGDGYAFEVGTRLLVLSKGSLIDVRPSEGLRRVV